LRFQLTILRIADYHPGLEALLLQIFYSIRSERMLAEQLD
jgi:transposase